MKPYWESNGLTIYHGRARDVVPSLNPADAVITDPPFFMPATHYQTRVRFQKTTADASILGEWWDQQTDQLIRILKPSGQMLVFADCDSFPQFHPALYRRFDLVSSLVWVKAEIGLGRTWRHQHELMILGRWTGSWNPEDGALRSDVLEVGAIRTRDRIHPVTKPPELLAQLIRGMCPLGGYVVDPFMGSGTTLEAALLTGRTATGIEAEEVYCEQAASYLEGVIREQAEQDLNLYRRCRETINTSGTKTGPEARTPVLPAPN